MRNDPNPHRRAAPSTHLVEYRARAAGCPDERRNSLDNAVV